MHIRPINVCTVVLQENSRDQQTHQTTSSGKMYVFTKLHGNLLDTNMDIIVSGAMWGTVISGVKKHCKLSKKWSSREILCFILLPHYFSSQCSGIEGSGSGQDLWMPSWLRVGLVHSALHKHRHYRIQINAKCVDTNIVRACSNMNVEVTRTPLCSTGFGSRNDPSVFWVVSK